MPRPSPGPPSTLKHWVTLPRLMALNTCIPCLQTRNGQHFCLLTSTWAPTELKFNMSGKSIILHPHLPLVSTLLKVPLSTQSPHTPRSQLPQGLITICNPVLIYLCTGLPHTHGWDISSLRARTPTAWSIISSSKQGAGHPQGSTDIC